MKEERTVEEYLLKMRQIAAQEVYAQKRWVTEKEGCLLRDIIKISGAKSYIESGTANGFSALWGALGLDEGNVYTFDPIDRPKFWDDPELGVTELGSKIHWFQDEFENLSKHITQIEHPMVVFIDGDHGQTAVREDWATIKPLLVPKDVVVFHDLNMSSVQKSWASIVLEVPTSQLFYFKTLRLTNALMYESKCDKLKELEKSVWF